MKHRYSLEAYGYRLRPIKISDAPFIVQVRLEDRERNRFIHPIADDTAAQEIWLKQYFELEGDFYFVIENRLTNQSEGLIAFYNAEDGRAEWGRWVVKKGSLAAAESVYLLYRIAFEQAGLRELYCKTISANSSVVSFHTSIGEKTRSAGQQGVYCNGEQYDLVEHYSDREHFYTVIAPVLEKKCCMIARRNLGHTVGSFQFHHIGVACKSIEKELPLYTLEGYEKEGPPFLDPEQGVKGQFLIAKNQPRLELLENLAGSHVLDQPLKRGQKLYHTAYAVQDIEKAIEVLTSNRAKIISPLKLSVYFGKRICFLMLPNMGLIEFVENALDSQGANMAD